MANLTLTDGMDQIGFLQLMRWAHGLVGAIEADWWSPRPKI
jgi:hypothetical protein